MPSLPTGPEAPAELLHGTPVTDPFRWLEDGADEAVRRWVHAQNQATSRAMAGFAGRAAIRARLQQLLSIGMVTVPVPRGRHLFYQRRDGAQNQPVLLVREWPHAPRVLLDPNALDPHGTTAVDWWVPSLDGRRLAYGVSVGGSERSVLRVLDVATGRDLPDVIPHCRAASLAWDPDGRGFYYTRYPAPGDVPPGEENYYRRVFYHRLGDAPGTDPLVFGEGLDPQHWPQVQLATDGRWLLCTVQKGWTAAELHVRDRHDAQGEFVHLTEGVDALFAADVYRDRLYVTTNWGAPRSRVLCCDLAGADRARPERWTQLVPEAEGVLQGVGVIGGRLFASYLEHAHARVRCFALDGTPHDDVPLPGLGSVEGPAGQEDGDQAFYAFTSYFTPPTVHRLDLPTGRLEVFDRIEADIDPERFTSRQVWYDSSDGTRVSMFVTHRRDVVWDGDRPTLLYGYGGFSVPLTPTFQRNSFVWLEQGGVLAVANLRGGGEYGEAWHEAGMLARKQSTFDDFLAAARWLIAHGVTTPRRLGIMGGSNGGLLVGAALTQAPELFGAAVAQVPLSDMLRFHRFLIGRLWIPEYGDPDDPEQFGWLYAYSPYHRVRDGVAYPATLLLTSEEDTRVDPMHARKLAARLQAATAGDAPILLRTEGRAGHGAGKPLSKTLEEYTDIWTFLFSTLQVPPPALATAGEPPAQHSAVRGRPAGTAGKTRRPRG